MNHPICMYILHQMHYLVTLKAKPEKLRSYKRPWETSHLFLEWWCEDFEQTFEVNLQIMFVIPYLVCEVFEVNSEFTPSCSEFLSFISLR